MFQFVRETTKESKRECSKKTTKKTMKKVKESATPALWDKDGGENKKSSICILIDWLTTEGNLSDYYGGTDKNGYTNSNRKETYHNLICNMIKQENGMYCVFHHTPYI
jgi:hypothetical protein